MINVTWILHAFGGQILHKEKISHPGNDAYLCQYEGNYSLLEEITHVDIERFFPEEMDKMIYELGDLKNSIKDHQDLEHIDKILGLCRKCKEYSNSQIIFNPFSSSEPLQTSQVL